MTVGRPAIAPGVLRRPAPGFDTPERSSRRKASRAPHMVPTIEAGLHEPDPVIQEPRKQRAGDARGDSIKLHRLDALEDMQSHRAMRWSSCCRSCTASTAMMSRTGLPGVVSTGSANFGRHVRHPRVHVPHRHVVVVRSNSLNTLTKEFDRCLRNMRCLQKSSMVSAFCAYMPAMSRPHCKIDIAGICAKCAHH